MREEKSVSSAGKMRSPRSNSLGSDNSSGSTNVAEDGIHNPFKYASPPSAYELGKVAFFFASGVALVRVVLFVFFMGLIVLVCAIATVGLTPKTASQAPLHPLRRLALWPMRYLVRCVLFTFGVWKINVKGKPDPRAALFTPNHCSLFDSLILFYLSPVAPVAKEEVFKVMGLRRILMGVQGIPVGRETQEGREYTKSAMKRYLEEPGYPKLLIFPQGTTTRNDALTMFQRGAFLYNKPVQAVATFAFGITLTYGVRVYIHVHLAR